VAAGFQPAVQQIGHVQVENLHPRSGGAHHKK
jgi:hypothetical protein